MSKKNNKDEVNYPPVPEEKEKKSIFARIRDFFKNIKKRIDDFFSSFQEDSDQNYSEQNEAEQSGSGHDRYADEYDEEFFTAQDARRERRRDFIFAMSHPKYVQFETQNQGYSSKAQNNSQKNNPYESEKTNTEKKQQKSSTSNNHGSKNEKQNEQKPNKSAYNEQEQEEDNNINNNIELPDGFTYSYNEKNGNTYIKKDNKDFMILNQFNLALFNEKKYIDIIFSNDLIKYVDQFNNSHKFQPTLKHSELDENNIFVCHYENENKDKYILDKIFTLADNTENIGGKGEENLFLYFSVKDICKIDKNAFSGFNDLKTIIIDSKFIFYPECRDAFIELFKNNKELDNILVLKDEVMQDEIGKKIDEDFIKNYCFGNAIPNNNLEIFFKNRIEEDILEELNKSDNQSKREDIMNRFGLAEGENLNKFANILESSLLYHSQNVNTIDKQGAEGTQKAEEEVVGETAERAVAEQVAAVVAAAEAQAQAEATAVAAAAAAAEVQAEVKEKNKGKGNNVEEESKGKDNVKKIMDAIGEKTVKELGEESDTETYDLGDESTL